VCEKNKIVSDRAKEKKLEKKSEREREKVCV